MKQTFLQHTLYIVEKDKQKDSEISNIPDDDDDTVETDRPPPLPPRKRQTSIDADSTHKRYSTSSHGTSWNGQHTYPVDSRSPSKRKRDIFQKKKYEHPRNTRAHSSSSSCCSTEDYNENKHMSEEDMNDRSGSRTPDPEHYNRDIWLKSTELFGKPYQKCSSSHSTLKYSPSSISCPEMEGANNSESLDKLSSLDMMFKSRRSPTDNTRTDFSIGSKRISHSVDSSPVPTHKDRKGRPIMRHRPHSFGLYGQYSNESNVLTDLRNTLKPRTSEYHKSNRKPLIVNDDPGSVSDLECIMENAKTRK